MDSLLWDGGFTTLAHLQRYKWVRPHLNNLFCLDDGCGSGYGTNHLAENGTKKIIGIDISSEAIDYAKERYKNDNLEFIQMDSLNIEFKDNCFDAIASFDVLEHIEEKDQNRFISEIRRVLKDNGTVYIGCPNRTVSLQNNPYHCKELTKTELQELLNRYFTNVRMFGQDLVVDGLRQGSTWSGIHSESLTYENLIIVEEDCNFTFGLLAICRN